MGTNYYLERKGHPCPTCGHDPVVTRIHVGKSSAGWVWVWRGWRADEKDGPGVNLTSPEEWITFLGLEVDQGAAIHDEYRQELTLNDLIEQVRAKRNSRNRHSDLDHGNHAVASGGDDVLFAEFC